MPPKGCKTSEEVKEKIRKSMKTALRGVPKLKVTCFDCGKIFFIDRRSVKRNRGKYCSRSCLGRAGAEHRKIWEKLKGKAKNSHLAKQAWKELYRALRTGTIKRKPCEVCSSIFRVAGHHNDYSKPLDVKWLCAKHHGIHHFG